MHIRGLDSSNADIPPGRYGHDDMDDSARICALASDQERHRLDQYNSTERAENKSCGLEEWLLIAFYYQVINR